MVKQLAIRLGIKGVIVLVMGAAPTAIWAQRTLPERLTARTHLDTAKDATYLQDFSHLWNLRVSGSAQSTSFSLRPTGLPYNRVTYGPNQTPTLGISVNYRRLAFGLSFRNPLFPDDIVNRGKSDNTNFSGQLFLARGVVDGYFVRSRGFYIRNAGDVYPGRQGGAYPQRPDIISSFASISYIHNFGWRQFSYRAAANQTERQLRSAGGWLFAPSISFQRVRGDSALLPNLPAEASNNLRLRSSQVVGLGLLGGYGYTLVLNTKWFVNGIGLAGVTAGFQTTGYPIGFGPRDDMEVIPRLNLRLTAGYNGDRWFGSVFGTGDLYGLDYGEIRFTSTISTLGGAVGYRFGG